MFMRFVQLKLNPKNISEFKEFYENEVTQELKNTDGCLFAGLIKSEPNEQEFISLTFWQSLEHAENYESRGAYKKLLEKTKQFLSESAEWKVQLSENMELKYGPVEEEPVIEKFIVAVQNKKSDDLIIDSKNMFIRILSIRIENDKLDEFKKLYSDIIVPSLKGIASCRYMFLIESVNAENEFISATIWDSKEDADEYESSEKFRELTEKVQHTFSKLYLWKMSFEKEYGAKIQTSEDFKVQRYDFIVGKSFS